MNKYIIVFIVLLVCSACGSGLNSVKNKKDTNCKITMLNADTEKESTGGKRSKDNFQEGLNRRTLGSLFRVSNRYMSRNELRDGKLIFYIYISGLGKVIDIETIYSDFEDCEFVEKIKQYLFKVNFGAIQDKNDISIFPFEVEFHPSSKNSNQRLNFDSVPHSGTSPINANR